MGTTRSPTQSPSVAPTDPKCKVIRRFIEDGKRMEETQCGNTWNKKTLQVSDLQDACAIKDLYCNNICRDPETDCVSPSVTDGEMNLLQEKFGKDSSDFCQRWSRTKYTQPAFNVK